MAKNIVSLGMPPNEDFHQVVGCGIIMNYYRKYKKPYVYYEVAVLSDKDRVPDLSFWSERIVHRKKKNIESLVLTVELIHSSQNKSYTTKSILDVLDRIPTLNESFMYNYDKDIWTRFSRKNGVILEEEGKDYSRVLKCYMHTFLD